MTKKILVGPLLGIESDNNYSFCFLTDSSVETASVIVGSTTISARQIKQLPSGTFWRANTAVDIPDDKDGKRIRYTISLDGVAARDQEKRDFWDFYVPGKKEEPRIAYTSCNGVSKADLISKIEDPFCLWREMASIHESRPFSLLLMGGDQLYADSIWEKVPTLAKWSEKRIKEQLKSKPTKQMRLQIDRFYSDLYLERWRQKEMSYMFASVPSVMMWDDHDIFDGWGSFPENLQNCDVYRAIFEYAKKYFEIFQIRSSENSSLLSNESDHYGFRLDFRDYTVLGLDNRSERTQQTVMSHSHWQDILEILNDPSNIRNTLLVMSAVPVVYRDFSFTETAFEITPWDESLTDDLKDHWRAKEHQGERSRLIMNLLKSTRARKELATEEPSKNKPRTIILSGDVHVGCLGVISDQTEEDVVKVHQVVSSGIVHPAPTLIAWLGIRAVTNDDLEYINEERTVEARMLKPVGSNQYIRTRNFATLDKGTDGKVWINWVTEDGDNPEYPLN